MVAIVTRAGKGSPLTNAEVDSNFTNLNSGKLETSNNLSDLTNAATARTNLGLGTLSTLNSISLSGDATGTSNGSGGLALTLSNSGVTAGTYGNATNIPQFAVDAKGRITSVSNVAVSIPSGSLTFTGDVTGTGSTGSSTALTLANSGVSAGTYTKVTVDAKGRVTTGASLASGDLPTYTGTITSSQVTTALGFTPYNSTNPSGYITNTGNARVGVENNGTLVGTRRNINFIPGTGISLSIADDSANEEVDITITSTVTGGVTSFNTRTGAVTLSSSDVTTALGFTPPSNTGSGASGTWGISITGNAATVTGGVYTTGNQSIAGEKQFTTASIFGPIASTMAQNDSSASLEIRNNGGTGDSNLAMIRFHATGAYGIKMGLRADGIFGIGGWSSATWRWYLTSGGDMVAAGNVTAYSDERLKKDWGDLPSDFVEQLASIKHGTYTRTDSGARQVGVSAQSLRGLMPEAVGVGADGDTLQVAYGNAALASAVRLAQRVVDLTARLHVLEQKMGA